MFIMNITNLATCFDSLNYLQANLQNTIPVHLASAHVCALAKWFNESKHIAKFLILIINICGLVD